MSSRRAINTLTSISCFRQFSLNWNLQQSGRRFWNFSGRRLPLSSFVIFFFRCIQIELKFPPIDFLRIFMPLLDGHSADFQIIELILDFFLKQVAFSHDVLKILVKYLLANIQRKKHLSYFLLNWKTLAPYLLKVLDSMPEAMRMCVFLVRRAPTRVCTFDLLWGYLR